MTTTPWAPPVANARSSQQSSVPPNAPIVIDRSAPAASSMSPPLSAGPAAIPPWPSDRRGLLRTGWLKPVWLLLQLAAIPVGVTSTVAGSMLAVLALASMMSWSGCAARNATLARPDTVYSSSPRPSIAAGSWLAPLAVVGAALSVVWGLIERTSVVGDLTGDARRDRIITIVAVVSAPALLVALYWPYSVMGRVASWVGGARRRWQHFFWLPILASILVSLVQWIFLVTAGLDGEDGRLGFVGTTSVGVFLGLVALPVVLTLWLGWTAMADTERATRITWERRNFPEGSFDLSDEFVARAATAAYLASHPDG